MQSPEEIKLIVKEKYAAIADQSVEVNKASCCGVGSTCGDDVVFNIMTDDYSKQEGYVEEADLGLGCGVPTEYAAIEPGMTVLDLGSGAGNDVFIAASETGPTGTVIGVDMTEAMIERANANKKKVRMENVEFRLGEIEALPVETSTIDVVISNCVLNLVPDKRKAFDEIYRVLKPGGHFTVSDIVLDGDLSPALRTVAELYAGCVSGALQKHEYLSTIDRSGFISTRILKEREIVIPDSLFESLTAELPEDQRSLNGARVLSVTVTGVKPE